MSDCLSLEAPGPGTVCGVCGQPLEVIAFCPECYERDAWQAAHEREGESHEVR